MPSLHRESTDSLIRVPATQKMVRITCKQMAVVHTSLSPYASKGVHPEISRPASLLDTMRESYLQGSLSLLQLGAHGSCGSLLLLQSPALLLQCEYSTHRIMLTFLTKSQHVPHSLEPRPSTQFFFCSRENFPQLRKKLHGRPGFEAMSHTPFISS